MTTFLQVIAATGIVIFLFFGVVKIAIDGMVQVTRDEVKRRRR